jgi:hypothetical protein
VIQPDAAYFHPELAEFILPYDQVRHAADPDRQILDFFRSTYETGANLAGWDRPGLEQLEPTRGKAISGGTREGEAPG